jgi:DNA-binding LytR/AlgR family response regulator
MKQSSIFIGGRQSINPEEVVRLQADVNYTCVFLSDGKKIVVATTLKEIENRFLPFPKFFRINKSVIINLDCIKQITEQQIVFKNGEIHTPSRRRKKAFFELFNHQMYHFIKKSI